jgi:hypothetical protein
MYTTRNFRSKKELKAAVALHARRLELERPALVLEVAAGATAEQIHAQMEYDRAARTARPVTYFQAGPFGGNEPADGTIYCEGPHYPEPHRWYAACTAKDGRIIKVK